MIIIISIVDSQPPVITLHPTSGRVLVGSSYTLMCSATSSRTLRFSWERSVNGSSWTTVSDHNTTSYNTSTSLRIGQYKYRCNVSSGAKSVVSNNATVDVYGKCMVCLCRNLYSTFYMKVLSDSNNTLGCIISTEYLEVKYRPNVAIYYN